MSSGVLQLSASLIVRDEEKFLEGCLRSLQGIVDEIVVVDTGSSDNTRNIALDFDARVSDFAWNSDFSAARNAALDLCRGEWILYIDADERARPCDVARLKDLLSDPSNAGLHVRFQGRPGYSPYWEMRLFRNHPAIRFVGSIHETIWPALERFQLSEGAGIGYSSLELDHFGYEGDQRHKFERNIPMLLSYIEQNPKRVYHWCHLAQMYEGMGDDAASVAALEEGLRYSRKKTMTLPEDCSPYMGLIRRRISLKENFEDLLDEGLRRFPEQLQLHWYRGRQLMDREDYLGAIAVLQELIQRGEARDFDGPYGYDLRIFEEFAFDALATCFFKLGRYADAERYYERAAKCDPTNMEYRLKRGLCSERK
jgi:glycosyltransferase involved in cell wall biosynthesis